MDRLGRGAPRNYKYRKIEKKNCRQEEMGRIYSMKALALLLQYLIFFFLGSLATNSRYLFLGLPSSFSYPVVSMQCVSRLSHLTLFLYDQTTAMFLISQLPQYVVHYIGYTRPALFGLSFAKYPSKNFFPTSVHFLLIFLLRTHVAAPYNKFLP